MTTIEALDRWLAEGHLTPGQHATLLALVRRERLSVFLELNLLLYLGVLTFAGGLAWTARAYSTRWGDAAILIPASVLMVGCFAYAFRTGSSYSAGRAAAPGFAFDYVLYLGCLLVGIELGYVEYRFRLLQAQRDAYLLASAGLFFWLSYRFDNRFVLSLALASLGGCFGVRLSTWGLGAATSLRLTALAYGAVVIGLGTTLHRLGLKRHFLDTYLHLAANVILGALTSGALLTTTWGRWVPALLAAAAVSVVLGTRRRRFAFVAYGVLYGYVGVSRVLLAQVAGFTAALLYLVVSSGAVVVGLVVLSRRFGREE